MPKTPAETSSNGRYNPYITKNISKSLLTPCRQVGLSRNRKLSNKTPEANSTSNSVEENVHSSKTTTSTIAIAPQIVGNTLLTPGRQMGLSRNRKTPNSANQIVTDSTNFNTTPVTSKLETGQDRSVETISEVKKTKRKSKVSKCLLADSDRGELETNKSKLETTVATTQNETVETKLEVGKAKQQCTIADNNKSELETNLRKLETTDKTVETKPEVVKTKKKSKVSKCLAVDCESSIPTKTNRNKSNKVKMEDIKLETDPICNEPPANSSRTLQTTKELKHEVAEISNEQKLLEPNEHTNNETTTAVEATSNETQIEKIKVEGQSKKFKRSLSMRTSSQESTGSTTKPCSVVVDPTAIKKLQKEVEEKRKLLDDLKRAEIYKKKHNVDELQQLTKLWKNGCISALYDLLNQLQMHTTINMATLLRNLQIPTHMISLTENDELV